MPPASGGSGGGSNVWGMLLQGVLEGVVQKMTEKTGSTPEAPKKEPKESAKPSPANPQQQSTPPMSGQMLDLLSKLSTKMNAEVPQGPPPKGQQPPAQTTAGVGAAPPPQQPPQPAAPTPQTAAQESRFKQVLEGIAKTIASPMVSARRGLEWINRAADNPDELIARGRERGGFGGRLEATTGGVIRGLQNDRELSGVGDIAGAAGDAAGGIPVVGKTAQNFFRLNETLLKTLDRIRSWNDRLHEGNLRFAEFSGSMQAVAREQQARDIQLSVERGERRAASAKEQAEAKSRLDRTLAPIEDAFGILKNRLSALGSNLLAKGIETASLGRLSGQAPEMGQSLHDFMNEVAEDKWPTWYGKPARFGNAGYGRRVFDRQGR